MSTDFIQYHTPDSARKTILTDKIPWAVRPGWSINDHDVTISVWVRTTDQIIAIVTDPDFQELVTMDEKIVDGEKGTVNVGWEEVYVENGQIVNVDDGQSTYPSFAECVKVGTSSKGTSEISDLNF
jgi:hypothetical protein